MAVNNYEVGKTYIFQSRPNITGTNVLPANATITIIQIIGFNNSWGYSFPFKCKNFKRYSATNIYLTLLDGSTYSIVVQSTAKVQVIFRVEELTTSSVPSTIKNYVFNFKSLVALYKDNTDTIISLPCPSTYQGSTSTLVDSARNTKGVVVAQQIRSNIAKVELSWNFLAGAEYAEIAQMFEDAYGGSFFNHFIFFNPTINKFEIREFYPSDRKFNTAKIKLLDGIPVGYQNVQLNLIEV